MRRSLRSIVTISVALLMAGSTPAAPQRGTGILMGIVLGPDDKPVARAAVTYQSGDGTAPHAVHTDARGRFAITKLRSDNYSLRASAKGVFSEWEKNVAVRSGKTKTITLRLLYAREMPNAYGATPNKP